MEGLGLPVLIMALTGAICGGILAAAAILFAVREDPRVEQVAALMPGINCGGCGYAGCLDAAKAIVLQNMPASICKPGGCELAKRIAAVLGVDAAIQERQVAIVLCKGDDSVAVSKSIYNGIADCMAAEFAGGGAKACRFGCLGLGSCARVCPTNAIEINNGLAIVHPDLCISCEQCVAKCPRRLIKMIPESRSIHVLCSSKDRGPAVKKVCSVGCIACTLCVKKVEGKGIKMEGNLALVDYSVPLADEQVVEKCPQHTIVVRTGIVEEKKPGAVAV